jgi:hypothetical protein
MWAPSLSRARLRLAGAGVSFVLLVPLASFSQPVYTAPQTTPNRDASDVSSWQEMRRLSLQLDTLALRARDEARIDQRHHGSEELAEKIDDFARDARRLRLYLNERNVSSSRINDQIRKLVDDARQAQAAAAKTDRHDPQTDADWTQALAVLNQINNQYLAANGLTAPARTAGPVGNGTVFQGTWTNSRRTMLTDLDRRADDAARLSESGNLEITPDIDRLRDQVRAFRQSMDELPPTDTRANVAHLLADARAVQADLAGSNASPQLRDDISSIVGTLVQMRDMTAEGTEGTSGFGPAPGIATDRYATLDAPQLQRELDNRVSRASDLASQLDLDDVSSQISHFRDKAHDFNNNAANLSPEDRREAIDALLQDAQKTQRALAQRHVSADLMTQWSAIVDLLVRLRDAS